MEPTSTCALSDRENLDGETHLDSARVARPRRALSQLVARDVYHAAAASVVVVAMQRHRHRASVQTLAVQAAYFALTEHGRSAEIVNLACTFLLLLSPCDIISNQICMSDRLRVVVKRRHTNSAMTEVQTSATKLVEAIQFIPGDILRKVEAQTVTSPTAGGPVHVMVASGMPPTLSRGETGWL